MQKVKIKSTGVSSQGPWVLVEWEIAGCAFLATKFLSCKALDPKWVAGKEIEVPKQLLK